MGWPDVEQCSCIADDVLGHDEIYQASGGSRGGAYPPPPPRLFLDQTETLSEGLDLPL